MTPLAFVVSLWAPQQFNELNLDARELPTQRSPADSVYTWRRNYGSKVTEGGQQVSWSIRLAPIVEWKRPASDESKGLQEGSIVQPVSLTARMTTADGVILGSIHQIAFEPTGSKRSLGASLGGDYPPRDNEELISVEGHFSARLAPGVDDWMAVRAPEDITVNWERRN